MGFFDNMAVALGLRQKEIDSFREDLLNCELRYRNEKQGAHDLQTQLTFCSLADQEKAAEVAAFQTDIAYLTKNLNDCLNTRPIVSTLPPAVQTVIDNSYKSYPEANITYGGLYVGTDVNRRVVLDVKTWALAGQNDYQLMAAIKGSGIHVSKYLAQAGGDFYKACDIAAMRVAERIVVNYVPDIKEYNSGEYWQWAPVTFAIQKGDCDDWAILRHAAYRIAGIPEGLLRITCGNNRNGEGHATNYYRDSTGVWRHINSTTSFPIHSSITEFPAQNNSSDQMGVTDAVWFSFNAEKAFHQFSTASAEDTFRDPVNRKRLLRYIKITPKVNEDGI